MPTLSHRRLKGLPTLFVVLTMLGACRSDTVSLRILQTEHQGAARALSDSLRLFVVDRRLLFDSVAAPCRAYWASARNEEESSYSQYLVATDVRRLLSTVSTDSVALSPGGFSGPIRVSGDALVALAAPSWFLGLVPIAKGSRKEQRVSPDLLQTVICDSLARRSG